MKKPSEITSFQMIDQVLNSRYCIQSLLGRKIGRRTFLANDQKTHSAVVIKLLLFGPDFTWEDLKLFEREAKILEALNHQLIPRYLDSFEVDTELGKGYALVQNYIEARSLQDWIEVERNFSEEEIKAIAKELLEILDYLHNWHPPVIHRDLKPSNILLSDRSGNSPGKVYLVDFGSVQTAVHDGTITVVGTYGYMPPEQFGGRTTPASDLYSLGATLLYLLTGIHPADLPSHNGRIRFEDEHIASKSFQTWLRYLIQPDLSQRFKSAQSALEALQNDQFRPNLETVVSKPSDSRVILTKTDEQLKITIPSLPIRQKLRAMLGALWATCLCLLYPLGLLSVEPAWGLFWAPFTLYQVSSLWISNIYIIFAKIQVLIDNREICFTSDCLSFKRKYSSSIKNILKLERQYHKVNYDYFFISGSTTRYSKLHIWVGNKRYILGAFNPTSREASRLTEVEMDWLAVELSDWLELPIQTSSSTFILNLKNLVGTEVMNTEPSSIDRTLESASLISSNPPKQLPNISRPANVVCTVSKDAETLEIVAPTRNILWPAFVCFLSFLLIIFCLINTNLVAVLLLGTVYAVFMGVFYRMTKRILTTKISLRINQHDISLWKQFFQSGQQQCLKRTDSGKIHKLQLVYRNGKKGKQSCHVKVCTDYSSDNSKDGFIIGDRKFWLSRKEAEWLAQELSIWLKMPITEVEAIKT